MRSKKCFFKDRVFLMWGFLLLIPTIARAHDPEMYARVGSVFFAVIQWGLVLSGGRLLGSKPYVRIWSAIILFTMLVVLFWGYDYDRYIPFLLFNFLCLFIQGGVVIYQGIKSLVKK
jgi:hypothetical protein